MQTTRTWRCAWMGPWSRCWASLSGGWVEGTRKSAIAGIKREYKAQGGAKIEMKQTRTTQASEPHAMFLYYLTYFLQPLESVLAASLRLAESFHGIPNPGSGEAATIRGDAPMNSVLLVSFAKRYPMIRRQHTLAS